MKPASIEPSLFARKRNSSRISQPQGTAQQMVEAFPWDTSPKYLPRDRDNVYGAEFRKREHGLGVEDVLIGPRKPWQSPFAERIIGSIRRECLDHVIVLNERHLKRILSS